MLKLKNKKLKGNISLLIILILLASSVIALLAINQIQNLMTYGNMTYNYFRAHYIAKAGLELGLTEVYNREDGFSTSVASGDSINTGNFVGWFNGLSDHLGEGESLTGYSGFEPYFTMTVTGSFNYLTNDITNSDECNNDNKIVLGTGEGIVIALFTDETKGTVNKIIDSETGTLTKLGNINLLNMDKPEGNSEYTFGLFIFEKDEYGYNNKDTVVKNYSNLNLFWDDDDFKNSINNFYDNNKAYITIRNSGNNTGSFCIGGNGLIPSSNSLITVQAHYGDMEVGLQSKVIKQTPFWALSSLGTGGNN